MGLRSASRRVSDFTIRHPLNDNVLFLLSYQVIKETLRVHPPGAGTLRTSGNVQEIGGYNIPANTAIMV